MQVYLAVLHNEHKFRLAHLTQDVIQGRPNPPQLAPFECTTPVSQNTRKRKLAGIIGGSIGGVVLLLSLFVVIKTYCRRPR